MTRWAASTLYSGVNDRRGRGIRTSFQGPPSRYLRCPLLLGNLRFPIIGGGYSVTHGNDDATDARRCCAQQRSWAAAESPDPTEREFTKIAREGAPRIYDPGYEKHSQPAWSWLVGGRGGAGCTGRVPAISRVPSLHPRRAQRADPEPSRLVAGRARSGFFISGYQAAQRRTDKASVPVIVSAVSALAVFGISQVKSLRT